jgi:hypothetical protein
MEVMKHSAIYRSNSKEISFCHSQHSTITTLNLAKYKLEQLQKIESQNIITKAIKKLQGKFRKIFSKGLCCNNADDELSHF